MKIYCIHDRISGEFGFPMFMVNDDDMQRRVMEAFKTNPFVRDLEVYYVGLYDSSSGYITPAENGRQFVLNVVDLFSVDSEVANAS